MSFESELRKLELRNAEAALDRLQVLEAELFGEIKVQILKIQIWVF